MKYFRLLTLLCAFAMNCVVAHAQYHVGTSTTGKTDIFGNTTTTHDSNSSSSDIWTW